MRKRVLGFQEAATITAGLLKPLPKIYKLNKLPSLVVQHGWGCFDISQANARLRVDCIEPKILKARDCLLGSIRDPYFKYGDPCSVFKNSFFYFNVTTHDYFGANSSDTCLRISWAW